MPGLFVRKVPHVGKSGSFGQWPKREPLINQHITVIPTIPALRYCSMNGALACCISYIIPKHTISIRYNCDNSRQQNNGADTCTVGYFTYGTYLVSSPPMTLRDTHYLTSSVSLT